MLYFILGAVVLFILFRVFARNIEDREVNSFGGMRNLLREFISHFEEGYGKVIILNEQGSKLLFVVPLNDVYAVRYDVQYIKQNIFVKYEIYSSALSGTNTIHRSEKLHFNNGAREQFEMFGALQDRLAIDLLRLGLM